MLEKISEVGHQRCLRFRPLRNYRRLHVCPCIEVRLRESKDARSAVPQNHAIRRPRIWLGFHRKVDSRFRDHVRPTLPLLTFRVPGEAKEVTRLFLATRYVANAFVSPCGATHDNSVPARNDCAARPSEPVAEGAAIMPPIGGRTHEVPARIASRSFAPRPPQARRKHPNSSHGARERTEAGFWHRVEGSENRRVSLHPREASLPRIF